MATDNDNDELNEILAKPTEAPGKDNRKLTAHKNCGDSPAICDEDAVKSDRLQGVTQWTTGDNKRFIPASKTCKKLTPAAYEIKHSSNVGTFFEKIPVNIEGLVRFPQANTDRVLREIQNFWDRAHLFHEYNLTHKRGILMWGPAGSGKSCCIKFVMKDVIEERDGIVVKFTSPSLFIDGMRIFREIEPETPAVILMEDIDAIIEQYSESEVLNILDGVDKVDKIVFLACPAPETKILKADLRWVRADSLKEGDELIAFDENGPGRRYRTTTVRSCPIVERRRYRVKTDTGSIVVSEKHPFLVKLGNRPHEWRAVEELRVGTKIATIGPTWETDLTRNGGYLSGQYDGEGCLNITYAPRTGSHGFRINWVQAEGEVSKQVELLLAERGFDVANHTRTPSKSGRYGPYKTKTSLNVRGGRWESLRLLGTIRPTRLLDHPRLKDAWENCRLSSKYTKVISVEEIDEGPVVALDTTTGTFIGEGMLQHNTTNYPELLGARIVNRPSRFDKRFKIGHPNAQSRMIYFRHILCDEYRAKKEGLTTEKKKNEYVNKKAKELNIELEQWVKDTKDFSIAHLKELFVAVTIQGDNYNEAIKTLRSMKDQIRSADAEVGNRMGFGNSDGDGDEMGDC